MAVAEWIHDGARVLKTDFELTALHTWLTLRAVDWDRIGKTGDGLLRGIELRDAQTWLGRVGASELELPRVTPLQAAFVQASQRGAESRGRRSQTGRSTIPGTPNGT